MTKETLTVQDVFSGHQIWAMLPAALEAAVHGRADRLINQDPDSIFSAFITRHSLEHVDGTLRAARVGDVGVLPMFGPVWARYQWQWLAADFSRLLADPSIKSIVIDIDSPGGMVTGCEETGALIANARGQKPITAFIAGMAASAGYWIASAADEIVVAESGEAGGLGVQATYMDWSKFDESIGIQEVTFISSQTPDKNRSPLEARGASLVQSRVDDMANVFLSKVAENRGVSLEIVLRDYGAGNVLVGSRAVEAGLADRVGSFEAVLAAHTSQTTRGGLSMTGSVDTGKGLAPGLYQVNAEGVATPLAIDETFLAASDTHKRLVADAVSAAEEACRTSAKEEATTAERERLAAISAIAEPGFEDVVQAGIEAGDSAEKVAMAILAKAKEQGTTIGAQRADATQTQHGGAAGAGGSAAAGGKSGLSLIANKLAGRKA